MFCEDVILQNKYLRLYEGNFGANELKDGCAHSASNEKLLKVKIVKNQTLCYYTGQLCRPMSIFLSIISKVTSTWIMHSSTPSSRYAFLILITLHIIVHEEDNGRPTPLSECLLVPLI